MTEQLDQHRPGHVEALRHGGAHLGVELHRFPGEPLQPAADQAGRDDEERHHHQRDDGDQPGQVEHRREHQDQADRVGDHRRQCRGDRLLRADHVAVQPADQGSGLGPGEERQRLPLDMLVHLGTQVVDEALPMRAENQRVANESTAPTSASAATGPGDPQHDRHVLGQDAIVDDALQQQRHGHRDHRGQRGQRQEDDQVQPVGAGIPRDPPHEATAQPLLGHRLVPRERAHRVPLSLVHVSGNTSPGNALPRCAQGERARIVFQP